jgi:hypothetical protein
MSDLATLRGRIDQAISDKVLDKVLSGVAGFHFKNGYKTDCQCHVCQYRRQYVALQHGKNWGHRAMSGEWFDVRYHRKELNRAFKRRVLQEEGGVRG